MLNRFIEVDGTLTRCLVAGSEDAPPLLLIHGLTLTSDIWLGNIDALGQDFRVVAIDMLGHGFTRPASIDQVVDIPAKLDHLLRLVDLLGFGQFAISGSSYGALIAANLFLRVPDRVTKLILNGSGSCFSTEAQLAAFLVKTYESYKPTLVRSTPEMWRDRLANTVLDLASVRPELLALLPLCYAQPWIEQCWEQTIGTMRDAAAFRPYRVLERIESISAETLIVWGREDRGAPYESATKAVMRMPQARIVAFERCGHLPMLEHPQRYNELVREFLLERPSGARSSGMAPR
jgi:pimeloyl-ACP methyl ester carboxylesterase